MTSELYAYTISAHVKRHRDQPVPIDNLNLDGTGDILHGFDNAIRLGAEWPKPPEAGQPDTRERVCEVLEVHEGATDDRIRYGRIRVNRNAIRHDVRKSGTDELVPIHDDDQEGRPLFFWFVAPVESTAGLLLTERRARFGILSSVWQHLLIGHLRNRFPDVTFELAYYVPTPVWEQYEQSGDGLEGAVLERVLVEEREDREQERITERRTIGSIKTHIDRRLAPRRERVSRVLRDADRTEAIQMFLGDHHNALGPVEPEEYDLIRLRLVLDGKRRSVILGHDRVPQLGHPVDEVEHDAEGYPQVHKMANFAEDLARSIGSPLGLS